MYEVAKKNEEDSAINTQYELDAIRLAQLDEHYNKAKRAILNESATQSCGCGTPIRTCGC